MISGETFSPTRLLFQFMKALSKSEKNKSLIAPNIKNLIKFLENNGKSAVYTGGYINVIYHYLEMIGDPPTFTTSCQRSHHFSPSYSINNDTASLQPVIADLSTRQKIICECFGIIGHKYDACIIRGPKFLPQRLRKNMNQLNDLHGEKPN